MLNHNQIFFLIGLLLYATRESTDSVFQNEANEAIKMLSDILRNDPRMVKVGDLFPQRI